MTTGMLWREVRRHHASAKSAQNLRGGRTGAFIGHWLGRSTWRAIVLEGNMWPRAAQNLRGRFMWMRHQSEFRVSGVLRVGTEYAILHYDRGRGVSVFVF